METKFQPAEKIYNEAIKKRKDTFEEILKCERKRCIDKINEARDRGEFHVRIGNVIDRSFYKVLKKELKEAGYEVSRLRLDDWWNYYFTIYWVGKKSDK